MVMFTSDNFNKYAEAHELLEQMIAEKIDIPFFVQCDTQIAKQQELVSLLGKAGCFEMFVGVESFSRQTLLAVHKTQNHPSTYGDIVKLCHKYGVLAHFSNIIGFPEDSIRTVREHLGVLRSLRPHKASFYILTPIPGTEQYDSFLEADWITEQNLDRFDGTTTTWSHPNLSWPELQDLLFRCYRYFYNAGHILQTAIQGFRREALGGLLVYLGNPLFARFSAAKRLHPMSGGISRVRLDCVSAYEGLREKQFGLKHIPLPRSLALSKSDAELNRRVKLALS